MCQKSDMPEKHDKPMERTGMMDSSNFLITLSMTNGPLSGKSHKE